MKRTELEQAIEEIITEILSENVNLVNEVEDDDDDSTSEKEPSKAELKKLEKELGSKNKKKDEIISAYKKIAGDIKEKAKAANSGNKEAKAWIDKHQDIIKAYRKLQKAS